MEKNSFNRRDFLIKGAKTIAVGALALSSLDILKLVASTKDSVFEESTEDTIFNLSDYPSLSSVGGYAMVTGNVIVIRKSSSKFIALSIVCTHKKCKVDFDGDSFECPCHGSTYDGSGKVTGGPAPKSLKSYKVVYDSVGQTLTINL
jgi:Rieske Fe-S protein